MYATMYITSLRQRMWTFLLRSFSVKIHWFLYLTVLQLPLTVFILRCFYFGAKFALNFADGSSADFCMMQSSLPSLCITLNGTTLSTIQQDKNIKYPGNSLTLSEDAASGAGFLQLKKFR